MTEWHWKDDYHALLEEGRSKGELTFAQDRTERRAQPRFRIKSQHVWIKIQPRFPVVDVSVTGMSVHSESPFRLGDNVSITLGKAFSLEAQVVDCILVVADELLMDSRYLVRLQFADETVGMQFLVMMKEMDDLEFAPQIQGG